MSYYPPGVTGREYAIAGADYEQEMTVSVTCKNAECKYHDENQDLDDILVEGYGGYQYFAWTCEGCGKEYEEEQEEPSPEPPDWYYD
jgi:hypothetical protein